MSAPTISRHPKDNNITVGTSGVIFDLQAHNAVSYQWQRGGINVSGAPFSGETTERLSVTNAQASYAGAYRCVVTNADGSTNSTSANLTVYQISDSFSIGDSPAIPDPPTPNSGAGTPEGSHRGNQGEYYWDTTGNDLYVKDSPGYGNTGWVLVTGGGGGGDNNLTGTGTPVGNETPDYIGQFYIDTANPYNVWFSIGLTNADWVMAVGNI